MPTPTARYSGTTVAVTAAEGQERGVAERSNVPRSAHAWFTASDRDATAILQAQNETRLEELVDLRMQRMAADPFSYYRGTAAVMGYDLAHGPSTSIDIISCGDAHISNFGFYASPHRTLVFDLNDFDEAAPAPFEWDVKRLVTSIIIGARQFGMADSDARAAALRAASRYRETLTEMMHLGAVDRYYTRFDADSMREGLDKTTRAVLDKALLQARKRTSRQFVDKVTVLDADGKRMFVENPPVLTHIPLERRLEVETIFRAYRRTVSPDIDLLLSQHEITDVAVRVVGVGSVGTRCFVLLLTGPNGETLVLQVKEAQKSVIGRATRHEGRRVVTNQRVLQAVSDLFLGHVRFNGRDFYLRQFRDMKGSIDPAALNPSQLATYAGACGVVLARAHSQSPRANEIVGYLGRSDRFDRAVVEWGEQYADQSLADYEALVSSL